MNEQAMTDASNPGSTGQWALILAGGDGTRLSHLTTCDGIAVPKQFCSLSGGQTLLDDAIERGSRVTDPTRVCVIVAAQHRRWWTPLLEDLPPENVMVQPRNRGTGIGLMYAAAHIRRRDPDARIVALPADHYVRDEDVLCKSLRAALTSIDAQPQHAVLLGVTPDHVDCELGYLAPGGSAGDGLCDVDGFIEKPDAADAARMVESGALWNTFVLAASVGTLLELFCPRYALALLEMRALLGRRAAQIDWPAMIELYERLPVLDFSRDVLARNQQRLRMLRVPDCGWSDLGTPHRVARTLASLRGTHDNGRSPFVDLADRNARLGGVSVLSSNQ